MLLVAERVAAELKLGVDVGPWWDARDTAEDQRLVEFFWEIVLTNTTAPVAILLDDVDAALALPFAGNFWGPSAAATRAAAASPTSRAWDSRSRAALRSVSSRKRRPIRA